jgi:hypothetical protein
MKKQKAFTPDVVDDIYSKLFQLSERIRLLYETPRTMERVRHKTIPDPVEAQIIVDSKTNCLMWFANEKWRSKCYAVHAIKVFADRKSNKIEDGAFRFTIEPDLADWDIIGASAFNGTAGSATSVQIRNVTRGINILNSVMTIPGGQLTTPFEFYEDVDLNDGGDEDDPNNRCHLHDMIWINCTATGGGAKGLGVYIIFRLK